MMRNGRCLCGSVTFEIRGEETWACHCHCESCRRQTASPMTTFLGIPLTRFRWTGTAPKVFASTPGAKRSFCATCGTPMAFQAERYEGEIHLYAATLDHPENFRPKFHVHWDEHLPWLELADHLLRYENFASSAGSK